MYYSYIEIEYVATSYSPARLDLALKLLNICQKPTKYGQSMFCEAVKVDMENSKKSSIHHTITSTLSLITVFFEDLFEAITLHRGIQW
jgi:hypothetical protein